MAANPNFLGKGWAYPVKPGASTQPGPLVWASEADKIQQSMWIILTTSPGERVMQPDFGCNIQDRVFGNLDEATIGQLLNDVAQALTRWEPRIDLLGIDTLPPGARPDVLLISIDYRIRSTNSRFNLVYPFYLT